MLKRTLLSLAFTVLLSPAYAATFGRVVPIGGHASDIALDEARGYLYIANFTAGRIDVMSLSRFAVDQSITVDPYPGSISISPDGRFLLVGHYAYSDGAPLSPAGHNSLTVIDLATNARRSFALSAAPVALAFANTGSALVLTQTQFLLFDPVTGIATELGTPEVTGTKLPTDELATFPPQIMMAAMTATPDRSQIYGIAAAKEDSPSESAFIRFSYAGGRITAAQALSSAPQLGPRIISVSRDGSYYFAGWGLFGCGAGLPGGCTATGPLIAQWPGAGGQLNIGSAAIRSSRSLLYGQMSSTAVPPPTNAQTACLPNGTCVPIGIPGSSQTTTAVPPSLLIMDSDNLRVRDRVQIPENLAGKSLFNSDESVMYAISDSGVTVFSMALLEKAPRVAACRVGDADCRVDQPLEDVEFRGNFCNASALLKQIEIRDPAGNSTPFQVCAAGVATCSAIPGITITSSSGTTPAQLTISVDPALMGSIKGTRAYQLEIRSASAINMPAPPSRGRTETYIPNVRSRVRLLLNNRAPEGRGTFFDAPGELVDILPDPIRNRFYVLRLDKNEVLVYDGASYSKIAVLRTSNTPTQMAITLDAAYLLVGHNDSQLLYRYDLNTLTQIAPVVFPLGHYPKSVAVSSRATLAASRVAGPKHKIDTVDWATLTASPLPSLGPYENDIHIATMLAGAPNGGTILAAMPDGHLMAYSAAADSFALSRKDFDKLAGAYAASSYGFYMVDHYLFNQSLVQIAPAIAGPDTSSGFAFVDRDGVSAAVAGSGDGYLQRYLLDKLLQSPDTDPVGTQLLPSALPEAPLIGDATAPFSRTVAPLTDRSAIVTLTTSGFTVVPWNYEAPTGTPVLAAAVSAADYTQPVAPGGLISLFGTALSSVTQGNSGTPLPTVLADSCLTANGALAPMLFISPGQINAQLPMRLGGTVSLVLHTPSGISNALNLTVSPTAPSVFRSGVAGPMTGIATVVRYANGQLVTDSNPVHAEDRLIIYLTGMGATSPEVEAGAAAPFSPLAYTVGSPSVTLGGMPLQVEYSGLAPGWAGLYQINVAVPSRTPTGFDIPLSISHGAGSTTLLMRVVN